jgi:hypothetical protein
MQFWMGYTADELVEDFDGEHKKGCSTNYRRGLIML